MKNPRSHLRKLSYGVVILGVIPAVVNGQGTFQNLDFEQADPVLGGGSPEMVTAASAFPDWTLYIGTMQSDQAYYNTVTTGGASIVLVSAQSQYGGVLDGEYSATLSSGGKQVGDQFELVSVSIEQNGTIPGNAQSMEYEVETGEGSLFSATFGGNTLTPYALGSGVGPSGINYTIYGVDVTAYAGHTGELEFTAEVGDVVTELDDISFSTQAVPEPNPAALAAIGGILLLPVIFKARSRRREGAN